ncbi:Uncharacterised protein [Mycobacterium tuberculosis]|nr:Uncharacterised protein [Mycobacterium tuberculosis]CNU55964.1 Uncharacterised protein [Mycobacterium tuberculosis]CNU58625.1 Uncharacterised protein [Mycobacterium tuberculosis]CNV16987.1 Uncharacterised protein [Mycobacterium tuberculosis]CNV23706.1 Uncharacterised protein [Mycobacterium tuberculosis]
MPGVLDLHLSEVLDCGAVQVHAPARQQREVHRVRRPDQMEALPVGVALALAAHGREKALRCGVGADHQRHVTETGQDLRASTLQRLGTAGTRGVAGADRHTGPAELLGERGTGDEARIPVADGVRSGDQLHVPPVHAGVPQRGAGGDHAILGEVITPFPPRVHTGTQDVNGFRRAHPHRRRSSASLRSASSPARDGIRHA